MARKFVMRQRPKSQQQLDFEGMLSDPDFAILTQKAQAEIMMCSRLTIRSWLSQIDHSEWDKILEKRQLHRSKLSAQAGAALYREAIKGNPKCLEMFFAKHEGWQMNQKPADTQMDRPPQERILIIMDALKSLLPNELTQVFQAIQIPNSIPSIAQISQIPQPVQTSESFKQTLGIRGNHNTPQPLLTPNDQPNLQFQAPSQGQVNGQTQGIANGGISGGIDGGINGQDIHALPRAEMPSNTQIPGFQSQSASQSPIPGQNP